MKNKMAIIKKAKQIEALLLNIDEWDAELFDSELRNESWNLIKLIKGKKENEK